MVEAQIVRAAGRAESGVDPWTVMRERVNVAPWAPTSDNAPNAREMSADAMGERDQHGFDWGGWAIPGAALLIAAALLIFTLMPPDGSGPGSSSGAPSPRFAEEHEVVTDEGIVSFRFEGDEIVVRLVTDGATTELGRTKAPFIATAPPGGTRTPTGTSMFIMVCGPAEPPAARRYVFGHLDSGGEAAYEGPEAVGHGTSDGLFLFALLPDAPSDDMTVTGSDRSSLSYPGDIFGRAASVGVEQPSGCFVVG
jgi:hypothetical protein